MCNCPIENIARTRLRSLDARIPLRHSDAMRRVMMTMIKCVRMGIVYYVRTFYVCVCVCGACRAVVARVSALKHFARARVLFMFLPFNCHRSGTASVSASVCHWRHIRIHKRHTLAHSHQTIQLKLPAARRALKQTKTSQQTYYIAYVNKKPCIRRCCVVRLCLFRFTFKLGGVRAFKCA